MHPVGLSRWAASPSWCPRPAVTADMLEVVRTEYDVEWEGEPVDIGGSSNLNLYLRSAGDGHVLRVHRAWVAPARLEAIQSVRADLVRRALPFTEAARTRSGSHWIWVGEHLAEVEPYLAGHDMEGWQHLMVGMRTLAIVHTELGQILAPPPATAAPAANHVGAHWARLAAARASAIIRSWIGSPADEAMAVSVEGLARELWEAEAEYAGQLVHQLVHGDFWDNNVKFRGDEVIGILDLDFMEERPRMDDLALTLYYAYPTLVSERGNEGAMDALADLVGSYASKADPALQSPELLALPFAIARMALHFTRHLALRENEQEQREVVEAAAPDLDWARAMVRDSASWQQAFSSAAGAQP